MSREDLFVSILLGIHYSSWIWRIMGLIDSGKVSVIISSKIDSPCYPLYKTLINCVQNFQFMFYFTFLMSVSIDLYSNYSFCPTLHFAKSIFSCIWSAVSSVIEFLILISKHFMCFSRNDFLLFLINSYSLIFLIILKHLKQRYFIFIFNNYSNISSFCRYNFKVYSSIKFGDIS